MVSLIDDGPIPVQERVSAVVQRLVSTGAAAWQDLPYGLKELLPDPEVRESATLKGRTAVDIAKVEKDRRSKEPFHPFEIESRNWFHSVKMTTAAASVGASYSSRAK
jgi:hypothetical protein